MYLPDGNRAVVDDAKLLEYVLDPDHPVGRHHAALFDRLLGITRENYEELTEQLLRGARTAEVEAGQESPFGQKFEMRIAVMGPRGTRTVLAVWIREFGRPGPRLVTCYVE